MPSGRHAYFDQLAARPDCLASYHLRTQEQLEEYRQAASRPPDVNYDPIMDAAKAVTPAGKTSLGNCVFLPIPDHAPQSLFATWDVWMAKEYAFSLTGIGNYKQFNFCSPARVWNEIKSDFNEADATMPGKLAAIECRYYGSKSNGEWGPNLERNHPMSPKIGHFGTVAEVWARYFVLFTPRPDLPATVAGLTEGTTITSHWWEFSLWMADVTREAVHLLDRLLVVPNLPQGATGWHKFFIEYNTSSHGLGDAIPERVSYLRNAVFLQGITDPTPLLQRPE